MKKNWTLTQESFDKLLTWLHPDRERAGEEYEHIRRALISFFLSQGSRKPEELADETINRVAQKIDKIAEEYESDPVHYFYDVAMRVYYESLLIGKKLPSHSQPYPYCPNTSLLRSN